MADDIPTERFSTKKYRVVERNKEKKTEHLLGDFETLDLANDAMKSSFQKNGAGSYSYSFYNENGVEVGAATGTKRKVLWSMRSNLFSSFSITA